MAKGKIVNRTPTNQYWWWYWRAIGKSKEPGEVIQLSDRSYKVDKNGAWRFNGYTMSNPKAVKKVKRRIRN